MKIEIKNNDMERLQVEGGLNSVENDIAKVMKDR